MIYKIEIPANRYDLLCVEGIASALRIFLGKDQRPEFKVTTPPADKILKMTVKKEVFYDEISSDATPTPLARMFYLTIIFESIK